MHTHDNTLTQKIAAVMAVCPYAGIWWGTYEKAKLWISQAAPDRFQGTPVHLAVGMVAGAVSSIFIIPLDIIKVCVCVCVCLGVFLVPFSSFFLCVMSIPVACAAFLIYACVCLFICFHTCIRREMRYTEDKDCTRADISQGTWTLMQVQHARGQLCRRT